MKERHFPGYRGEPIEFGAYRPLAEGERVNQDHIITPKGKPGTYIPVRIYGHKPNLNSASIPLFTKGKA